MGWHQAARGSCASTGQLAAPLFIYLDHPGHLAQLKHLFSRGSRKEVHAACNDARPTGLMAGAQAGAVVAVEILVEQDEIAPVRIILFYEYFHGDNGAGLGASHQTGWTG